MSAGQQLQRINEILDSFYEDGTWRGVRLPLALTSSSGVITLPAGYLRLDKRIRITTDGHYGCFIDIVGPEWRYRANHPGTCDKAVDLGDNASGQRQYRLTEDTEQYATYDALTYEGLARKRFVYITDTATVVVPDNYSALELGWRAKHAQDEQANELAKDLWGQAFAKLDAGLGEFEQGNEMGVMPMDPMSAAPCYNAV